jgi:hypothetical protein
VNAAATVLGSLSVVVTRMTVLLKCSTITSTYWLSRDDLGSGPAKFSPQR